MPQHKEKIIEIKPKGVELTVPAFTGEILEHFHETDQIDFRFLRGKKLYVHHTLFGSNPDVAANYDVFFTVPFECTVTEIRVTWGTAGSSSSTLDFEKLTGTTATNSGSAMLASTVDTTAAANTVTTPVLTATIANLQLSRGDRIAIKDGGTLTSLANLSVVVELTF